MEDIVKPVVKKRKVKKQQIIYVLIMIEEGTVHVTAAYPANKKQEAEKQLKFQKEYAAGTQSWILETVKLE